MESNNNRRATLTTLQARTALAKINATNFMVTSEKELRMVAGQIYKELIKQFPRQFPIESRRPLIALILSNVGMKAVKEKQITEIDYLKIIAREKQRIEKICNDFGAFGDMLEILTRIALIDNMNLIRANMLHVKQQGKTDICSKKFGRLEIGHNGKTLSQGTLFDYMAGEYDGIVYGVFNDAEKKIIYEYCKAGNFGPALNIVANNMVYWADKYQFQADMDNLTRGKGITEKGNDIQVIFNPSKYDAFKKAIASGKFITIAQMR